MSSNETNNELCTPKYCNQVCVHTCRRSFEFFKNARRTNVFSPHSRKVCRLRIVSEKLPTRSPSHRRQFHFVDSHTALPQRFVNVSFEFVYFVTKERRRRRRLVAKRGSSSRASLPAHAQIVPSLATQTVADRSDIFVR